MKTKKHQKTQPGNRLNLVLLLIAIICILGAGVLIFNKFYFTPKNQVQREIESLAAAYYENYLYDNYFLNIPESDRTAEFERYLDYGMNPVYLRELLNYDSEKSSASAKIFQSAGCDTNSTSVKYFPESPYGKTDYRVDYELSCEALEDE